MAREKQSKDASLSHKPVHEHSKSVPTATKAFAHQRRITIPPSMDDESGSWIDGAWVASCVAPLEGQPVYELFDEEELATALNLIQESSDKDLLRRDLAVHARLTASGPRRVLRTVPPGYEQIVDRWNDAFPNGGEVFDYLRGMCALAQDGDNSLRMSPLLFDGPPGVGKTLVAELIGSTFGASFVRVSMAAAETGSTLSGSDRIWSNTRIGKVFDELTSLRGANPCFLLDELDKTTGDPRFDPLGPLHDLLEPTTAKSFRDLSFPTVRLDASRVLWIATSNNVDDIPDSILNRFIVFRFHHATDSQIEAVVRSVIERAKSEDVALIPYELTESAVRRFCGTSPRSIGKLFRAACGRAARERRLLVDAFDIPLDNLARSRRIGF